MAIITIIIITTTIIIVIIPRRIDGCSKTEYEYP
jgi:hypothetical protein